MLYGYDCFPLGGVPRMIPALQILLITIGWLGGWWMGLIVMHLANSKEKKIL